METRRVCSGSVLAALSLTAMIPAAALAKPPVATYQDLTVNGIFDATQGVQVNGVVVIDPNRNFQNVASLSSTGAIDTTGMFSIGGVTVVDSSRNVSAVGGTFTGPVSVMGALTANGGLATTTFAATGNANINGILTAGTINSINGYQVGGTTVIDASRNMANVGTISASGNVSTTGAYQIGGVTVIDASRNLAAVNGNLSGTLDVSGLLTANAGIATTTLNATGNATVSGMLTGGMVNSINGYQVGGTSIIDGSRNLSNIGSITASGNVNTAGSYQVGGVTVIDASRNVAATNGSFSGPVSVAGLLSANGGLDTTTLNASGNATVGGMFAGGTVNSINGYQVGGTSIIDGSRNLSNIGTISASGNVSTTGAYQVSGVTVIDASRNLAAVNGSFSGPLSVAGLLSANGGVTTTTFTASGNATIGGVLTADTFNAANGYQVGGTSIIDSSRNMSNIGSITASGNVNTAGSYEVGGVTVIDASRNLAAANGSFSGPVSVAGLLSANGGINTTTLTASGNATIGSTLTADTVNSVNGYQVGGTSIIDGSRNLSNIGTISASGNISTTGAYQIDGITVIDASRNLTAVNGSFSGPVSVAGLLSADGGINTTTLTASGNATIGGLLTANTFDAANGYQVGGMSVIDNNRNLTNIGSITASGNINTDGAYQVGGVTVIDANRNLTAVNGNISGALNVGGLLTASGGIATTTLNASGDATIGGNLGVGDTLNVANRIQINGTTVVDANRNLININGISASGNIDTAGAYQVAGVTVIDAMRNLSAANGSFSGAVNVAGLLSANGGINTTTLVASGAVNIGDNLTLGGSRTVLAGFDANSQHWIVANGAAEPASRFLGFEKTALGAGRIIANVPLSLVDGTAANPALGFASSPSTGLFAPGANSIAVATAGAERLRIDAAGNAMIGNISGGNYLQVAANGSGSVLSAKGSATDVSLYLAAKGNGKLVAQSVLAFDSTAQGTEGSTCPEVGAITTNSAGDILTCQ